MPRATAPGDVLVRVEWSGINFKDGLATDYVTDAVLKSAATMLGALGAVHTLAGATVLSPSTPSPASDGRRIFAIFSSNDCAALDLDGNLLWYRGLGRDYPNASNSLGMSSSLTVADGVLIAMLENDSESFTAGIDAKTGVISTVAGNGKTGFSGDGGPAAAPVAARRRVAVVVHMKSLRDALVWVAGGALLVAMLVVQSRQNSLLTCSKLAQTKFQ